MKNSRSELTPYHFTELSQDLMCAAGFDGYFKYVNPAWEKLLGYSEKELLSKPFLDFIHPDDHKKNDEEVSNLTKGRKTIDFENRYICKDGSIRHIQWKVIPVVEEKVMYCIGRDLTTYKQKEEEAFQLKNAVDNSCFGVVIASLDGTNLYINNALYRLTGYDPNIDELKSTPIEIGYAEPDKATKAMQELIANGYWTGELLVKRKNGTCFDCQVSATVIKNDVGESMHILANHIDITEEKKLRLQIKKSERNYKNIFNNALVAIFRIELSDGKIISANLKAAELFGYSSIDDFKRNFRSINHYANPEDRESIIGRIKNDGHIENVLMHSKKVDGTLFWNEASFKLDKKNEYIDCASIDVTQRVEQEKSLIQTKNSLIEHKTKFEILSEVTFEGILIHDKGFPINMNNYFSKMFGYTEDELMDKDLVQLIVKKEFHKIVKDNIRNEHLLPYEVIGIKKDGTEFPIEIEGKTYISENNKRLRVTAIRDITIRKKQREKIEESQQRYKLLSELSIEGIAIHKEGLVVDVNDGLCKIFERKREEFIGVNVLEMLFPKKSLDIIYEKFKNDSAAYELLALKPDGTEFWIELEAKNYYIDNEKLRVTAVRDISEKKQKEIELLKAKEKAEESDRLKTAFLENMSHEIRTPMNGILGFSKLLNKPGLQSEKQQAYIKIIQKSGARMLNILSEIVEISKIESGAIEVQIEQVDINKKMESVYETLKPDANDKSINLSLKNSSQLTEPILNTDEGKLDSILTNLVKNAIKYTDEGLIEFGYNPKEVDGKNFLEFYVKDTGIGIQKERQEAIFERFIQANIIDIEARQGAGLGLAIAKSHVEILGGKVWVESEIGIGSTFYFTLPYTIESKEKKIVQNDLPSKKVREKINPKVSELKILIVEDDETSTDYLSTILDNVANKILVASSGIEAVKICQNNPDINLILMDIQMPEMNGYEATKQIRKFNKEVVILAQTAFAMAGDREKSIAAGCNDYISKPIMEDKLEVLIQSYFKK